MGYSTDFEGELKFKKELTGSQLAFLQKFLGKDRRYIGYQNGSDNYDSDKYGRNWYNIDLKLCDDFGGICWDGSEKTYELDTVVNFLTDKMRLVYPDFELTGELNAQGDDMDDRWTLVMEDGIAVRVIIEIKGKKITCPNCEENFILEEE